MENIESIKNKSGKIYCLIWIILAVSLVVISVFSVWEYRNYKKGQEIAVEFSLEFGVHSKYSKNEEDYELLVKDLYDYYHPYVGAVPVYLNGATTYYTFDGSEAEKADEALGEMLTTLGYACDKGSHYLKHIGFVDCILHSTSGALFSLWLCCAIFILTIYILEKKTNFRIIEKTEEQCF